MVIAAKRGGEIRYAACMVAATARADVNGLVRRHLDARKIVLRAEWTRSPLHRHGVRRDHAAGAARGLACAGRRGGGQDRFGDHRIGYPRIQAQAAGPLLAALPAAQVLPGLGIPVAPRSNPRTLRLHRMRSMCHRARKSGTECAIDPTGVGGRRNGVTDWRPPAVCPRQPGGLLRLAVPVRLAP